MYLEKMVNMGTLAEEIYSDLDATYLWLAIKALARLSSDPTK